MFLIIYKDQLDATPEQSDVFKQKARNVKNQFLTILRKAEDVKEVINSKLVLLFLSDRSSLQTFSFTNGDVIFIDFFDWETNSIKLSFHGVFNISIRLRVLRLV
jgi:hypothetical protein